MQKEILPEANRFLDDDTTVVLEAKRDAHRQSQTSELSGNMQR